MYSNRNNHYHHGNRNNLNDPPPSLFPLMDTIMAINVVMVIAMIIIMTGRSIGIIVVTMISMIAIRPFFSDGVLHCVSRLCVCVASDRTCNND